ncbi:MAG: diguanylate cyclase domain-containing protein [Pontibacterium sp.]
MLQHVVYADLNCPFCYALEEQLHNLDLLNGVEWRLIEHAPDISIFNATHESQAELASEVFTVRSRAPNVQVSLPPLRSDSRFANLCVIAAREIDPAKALRLLRNLYRALWVEGRDISATSVIYDCIIAAGLPGELSIEDDHEQILNRWQQTWEQGPYSLRIPVLAASDHRKLTGLPGQEHITAFFGGEQPKLPVGSFEQCHGRDQQTIAFYGHGGVQSVWNVIAAVRDDYNIQLPASLPELKALFSQPGAGPDLVLLNSIGHWDEMLSDSIELIRQASENHTPVALIGDEVSDREEIKVYEAGAADYLLRARASAILRARIRTLLTLKRSHDLLERAARIDGLTQIYNRREFERSLEVEWLRGQRSKQPVSLIMLDVDHFKDYNDHYGHLTGDGCLQHVATAISGNVQRAQDMVCRFGGEEFVVLLPETALAGTRILADKLRRKVEELQIEHQFSSASDYVTISLGIATLNPVDNQNPHVLIQQADEALYRAKSNGRNCISD